MMALEFMKTLAAAIKEKGGNFELRAYNEQGELRPVTGLDVSVASRGSGWVEQAYVDTRDFDEPG